MQEANQNSHKIDREALARKVPALSAQQRTILRLIWEGKDNAEICRRTGQRELFTPGNPLGEIYKSFDLRHMRSAHQKRSILREVYEIFAKSAYFIVEEAAEVPSQEKAQTLPSLPAEPQLTLPILETGQESPDRILSDDNSEGQCIALRLEDPAGVVRVRVVDNLVSVSKLREEGFRIEFVIVGPGTSIRHVLVKRT